MKNWMMRAVKKMKYKVSFTPGNGCTFSEEVNNVSDIVLIEGAYFFCNEQGETLFLVPRERVVCVERVDD